MNRKKFTLVMRTVNRAPRRNFVFETLENLGRGGLFRSSIPFDLAIFDSGSPHPGNTEFWQQVAETRWRYPQAQWHFASTPVSPNLNAARSLQFSCQQDCEWVVFLEDDLDVCADFLEGLNAWLRRVASPDRRLYSLCAAYPEVNRAFPAWNYPINSFYGSQAYVLRREDAASAAAYLAARRLYRGTHQGHDALLREWAQATWPHLDYFTAAAPNMIQHIGCESSLHPGSFHNYPSWRGREWSFFAALTGHTAFSLAEQDQRPFSPRLARALAEYLPADRPIHDLGCSTGLYVEAFLHAGRLAFGYDGTPGINTLAKVRVDHIDLLMPASPDDYGRQAGSVVCLEVAEHIPAGQTNIFLDTLASFCDEHLVLSWAIPGQGGRRHVHEQDEEFVLSALRNRGFELCSNVTSQLRSLAGQDLPWFGRSLYVFCRDPACVERKLMPRPAPLPK